MLDLFLTSGKQFAECIKAAGLTVIPVQEIQKREDERRAVKGQAGKGGNSNTGGGNPSVGTVQVVQNNGPQHASIFDQIAAEQWGKAAKKQKKDEVDLMDPSAYSSAPQGG